jgi:AraC family transcriptional regulator of adaptative response/methylated-DNA-[protein]-cysteine methyltransferase
MFAGAANDGLCLLEFTDRRMLETEFKDLEKRLNAIIIYSDDAQKHPSILNRVRTQLNEYFSGRRKQFSVPLTAPGTDFQQSVWKILRQIPYGTTRSYKKQAMLLGKPQAVRAVANANGHNRISIIIPCHRVIGEDGALTGYGGGLWRKKWLLEFEKSNLG